MFITFLLTTVAWADCMPLSLDEVSEQARVLMSQGEPKLALAKVDEAIANLPCRTELIRVEDLGELYQVGGTAARQAGDLARATALYGRAARMVAPVEFFGSLGDMDRQTYEAQLSAASPPHSSFLVTRATVLVDGYELRAGVEQGVPSGAHLVQELLPDGSRRSTVVEVPAGGRVEVGESPVSSHTGRKVGLTITGLGLVLGGGTCLVEAGIHRQSLGLTQGREDVRDDIGRSWPGFADEQARLERTSMTLQVCGVAGISVGSALLGGTLLLSHNSVNFTKTW